MPDTSYEKTQDPTPHRRQKAREEGSVAKSQDLGSAVVLIAGIAALLVCGGTLVDFLAGYGKQQLGGARVACRRTGRSPWPMFDGVLSRAGPLPAADPRHGLPAPGS